MIYAILDSQFKINGFDPSEVISLTFAEAKFNDIVQRGGTLSNQVKISKTSNNQMMLGLLDNLNADTPQAYKLFEADLYVDDLKVFTGNAQILESNEFYTIRFFSSSAGFFNQIRGRKLNTINLSSYNHTWTAPNVNTKRTNTDGVVYPNINYGLWTDVANTAMAHTEWFPAVYINTLFSRLATELGYTYTPLAGFNFVLPFSKKDFTNNVSIPSAVESTADQFLVGSSNQAEFSSEIVNNLNLFVQNIIPPILPLQKNYTTLNLTGKGSVELELVLHYTTGANLGLSVLQVFDITNNTIFTEISVPPLTTDSSTIKISIENPDVFTSREIVLRNLGSAYEIVLESGSTFKVISGELTIQDGENIAIQDTLPDLTITDLFKYVAVKENALIMVNNRDRTIEFFRFENIANRFYEAIDLSDKVQNPESIKKYYRLNEYAQNNHIDYKVPDTNIDPTSTPESRGRGTFTIADTNLEVDKVLYEAPFYRTGNFTGIKTKREMPLIPRYSDTSLSYNEPDLNPSMRVLFCAIDTSILIQVSGQALPSPQANVTFVNFQRSVDEHWGTFQTAMNQAKIIEVPLNVSEQDIEDIDFTKPVSLLDAYWYVMEIKQYEVNRPTATIFKLLRLF